MTAHIVSNSTMPISPTELLRPISLVVLSCGGPQVTAGFVYVSKANRSFTTDFGEAALCTQEGLYSDPGLLVSKPLNRGSFIGETEPSPARSLVRRRQQFG